MVGQTDGRTDGQTRPASRYTFRSWAGGCSSCTGWAPASVCPSLQDSSLSHRQRPAIYRDIFVLKLIPVLVFIQLTEHCVSYADALFQLSQRRLRVCLSVTRVTLYQNDASQNHEVFTLTSRKDSSLRIRKASGVPEIRKGSQEGRPTPSAAKCSPRTLLLGGIRPMRIFVEVSW